MMTQALAAPAAEATPLVPVFLGQIGGVPAHVCDGRTLHTFLEVARDFATWLQERIEKYGFQQDQDFALVPQNRGTKKGRGGDRRSKDYHLSLDMAKELSMVENNDKGRQARRYFIDMEKKALAAAGQVVPASHVETLTPSEQQTLSEIAHRKAEGHGGDAGKVLAEIWSRLHRKFRIAKYCQLPRTQLADAILYVTQMELRTPVPAAAPVPLGEIGAWLLSQHGDNAGRYFYRSRSQIAYRLHAGIKDKFGVKNVRDVPADRLQDLLSLLETFSDNAYRLWNVGLDLELALMQTLHVNVGEAPKAMPSIIQEMMAKIAVPSCEGTATARIRQQIQAMLPTGSKAA